MSPTCTQVGGACTRVGGASDLYADGWGHQPADIHADIGGATALLVHVLWSNHVELTLETLNIVLYHMNVNFSSVKYF